MINFKERREEMKRMRSEMGWTLKEIGDHYGITGERARQIVDDIHKRNLTQGLIIDQTAVKTATIYSGVCFACNGEIQNSKESLFAFCFGCYEKFFLRSSGSEISGMDRTREIARIRDHHTCQLCKRVWERGTRRFDIHHLNGECGKRSKSYDRVSEIDGLITLCHRCHLNLDGVRTKMATKSSPRKNKPPMKLDRYS